MLTVMLAFFSVSALTSPSGEFKEKEVQAMKRMVHWVLTTWATRSWGALVAEVKAISLYARSRSLRVKVDRSYSRLLRSFGFGTSRAELAQVATLGRALPPALPPQRQQALREHRAILESGGKAPVTDPSVLLEIREFARRFAKKYRPSDPLARPWLGPGACLEASRAEGGQLGALAKWEAEFDASGGATGDCVRKDYSILSDIERVTLFGPPPDEVARVVADSLYRDAEKLATLSSFPVGVPFQCRRVVVAEPGCKARVVTCHPIRETALAQYLRMKAYGSLYRYPPTAAVLRGDFVGSLREVFEGAVVKEVCSADLTNATDYLHQDAAIAMCETVFKVWGLPPSILERIPQILGAHDFDGWSNHRGILMGGALSWFVLCLLNSFCASVSEVKNSFRVCGDDLIANFSKSEFEAYVARCDSVGFRVNRSKSFMSKDSGVFAERAFRLLSRREERNTDFPPLDSPFEKTSCLVAKEVQVFPVVPAKIFRLSPSRVLRWDNIGPSLTAAMSGVPPKDSLQVCRRMRRLVGMIRPKLAQSLYKAGIDAAAPRVLGGGELPWLTRYTGKTRRLASILASKVLPLVAMKEGNGELLLSSDLAGAYNPVEITEGSELIRSCALGDIPASRIIYRPEGLLPDDVVIGNWAEIVRDAESLHGRQLREWGVVPPAISSQRALTIARVARDYKRRAAAVIAAYPHGPVTHHLEESLKKRFRLEHVFALPFRDNMVVTHDAGRRSERAVPCGADVQCNRRFYRRLLPAFFSQLHGVGISQA